MQQESNATSFPWNTTSFRLISLEQQLQQIQEQLKSYVPLRENALQLQDIQQRIAHMERDVVEMKGRLERQEKATRIHEEEQRESLATLQIKTLWGMVSFVVVSAGSIFTGYITHFFH